MSDNTSVPLHPGYFVAIVGGAVAGSEAAHRLAERGIYCAVFDQHDLPYGKIEDGLPIWHVKLRVQEERKIDERLSHPYVFYVPHTTVGEDIHFYDLIHNWGFSAVLMANGAWKDRPLPLQGIDEFVGRGFEYQNPLVTWFNHHHDPNYAGSEFELLDDAIVVGGGLASLDVVKILMLETVAHALHKRGDPEDILHLEHKGIEQALEERGLTLEDLGLVGCTLYYRRRACDMPLATMPPDAAPEKREKVFKTREKILKNCQRKYLFRFQPCRAPSGFLVENGRMAGLTFKETEIVDGRVVVLEDVEHTARSPLIISSIGSTPEPIDGVRMNGEVYEIRNPETGRFKGHDSLFALGNVVTGKGNIHASHQHAKKVADHVAENVLAWRAEDYEKLIAASVDRAKLESDDIVNFLHDRDILTLDDVQLLLERIQHRQLEVGHDGDYRSWISSHAGPLFDEEVAHAMAESDMELQRASEADASPTEVTS